MDVRVSTEPASVAAHHIAAALRLAIADRHAASLAVSGGSTAPPLFEALAGEPDVAWTEVSVWQVDERIAPDGHVDRNAGQLVALPGIHHPMPVTGSDIAEAAADYGATLPHRFDVVHLGLGDDGHTASWAPRPHPDAGTALTTTEPVFTVGRFNGRERMTVGVGVVNRAATRVVLVSGAGKADVVARWVHEAADRGVPWIDETLPIAAVDPVDTVVFLDPAAAAGLEQTEFVDADGRAD